MNINGIVYFLLVLVSFVITMAIDFGIPFLFVAIGAQLALWKFSWGLVFFFYVAMQTLIDIKSGMDILGIRTDDE